MSLQNITSEEFESTVLSSETPVLVDFYASWCGPCKQIALTLEEVSKENPSVKIVKVDVDSHAELAAQYNVTSIPTLILFAGGAPTKQILGAVGKSEIEKLFR